MLKSVNCGILLALLWLSTSSGLVSVTKAETVPNPDHMIIGTSEPIWNLDPTLIGNHTEIQLARNVYETLIFFDKGKTDAFVPDLATTWSISEDGFNYTFTIRPGVRFHNNELLTTEDVEYSFERILVTGYYWVADLFYDALLGLLYSRDATSNQIDNAVTHNDTTVTFHLARPFPAFLQILANVGFIVNKNWCVSIGEWPGTWSNWTAYLGRASKIEEQPTGPPGPHTNAMCGTGPYMLDYFERDSEYSVTRFDGYWGGWPASGANGSLQRVTVKKIVDWATRRDLFLTGQLDMLTVPKQNTDELLGQPGIRSVYPLADLSCSSMLFNFNISSSSPFLGVPGGLLAGTFSEEGTPPDMFDSLDVRKGFAYAFNYSKLIAEALSGEAYQPATPVIPGLPFCNPLQEKYTTNMTKAQEYLQASWNGQLWNNGFNMTLCYNPGSYARRRVCEILKENVEGLNSKFHITLMSLPFSQLLAYYDDGEVPIIALESWLADFVDPYNLVSYAFMKSTACFPHQQSYRNPTIDLLADEGLTTTNATLRKEIYYELQRLYWEDCPGVPLYQQIGRKFMRDWVQGWYFNPLLYSGVDYFYALWKADVAPNQLHIGQNIVDLVNATDTLVSINATSEGSINVRSYDFNLDGTASGGTSVHSVKCLTIDTTVPSENVTFPIEIRMYYTDAEVVSAHVDQSTLRMFYWNGTDWLPESDSGWISPSDKKPDYYAGYVWAKIYHLSQFAVMGQPALIHAVAPKGVRTLKTSVGQDFENIVYVDVFNQGDYDEIFNVSVYANSTLVNLITNVTLAPRNSATLTLALNTAGYGMGKYRLVALADPVLGENQTSDNTFVGDWLLVTISGNINGDNTVDIYDAILLANAYNSQPVSSNWSPNADINGDGIVDIFDAILLANHFNQHYP